MKLFNRPPKIKAQMVGILRGRIVATGSYSAFPFNPLEARRVPPFRVCMNGKWHEVEVVDHRESFGWRAESVIALNVDKEVAPVVEIRSPR
jgi:hypothetical protein